MSESVAPSHGIAFGVLPREETSWRIARVSEAARLFLPTTFITLWIGFALIPGASSIVQASFAIALAAFAGFGAVITARRAVADGQLLGGASVAGALPFGVVLLMLCGLTSPSVMGPAAPSLAALAVVAVMALQLFEFEKPGPLVAVATGLVRLVASVLGLIGCALVMSLPLSWLPFTASLIGLVATPAIVRGSSLTVKKAISIGLVSGLAAGEMVWVLLSASLPVWATSAALVVTLLAIAGTCAAAQRNAPSPLSVSF
ncbi:MAG: hypothetical protein HW416_930 [Chloroflexi bacterium]|nr:hypothetical protein [Chloroflexota bacterium]